MRSIPKPIKRHEITAQATAQSKKARKQATIFYGSICAIISGIAYMALAFGAECSF